MNRYILSLVLLFHCILSLNAMETNENSYNIQIYSGKTLLSYIPHIAQKRIEMYRAYPYLYEGTMEIELECLTAWAKDPSSALVAAHKNDEIVGFIPGTSLVGYEKSFPGSIEAFKQHDLEPRKFYYFMDVLVEPAHQGKRIAARMLDLFEKYCSQKNFDCSCFVCECYDAHPLKPQDYRELDVLWEKLGYSKTPISVTIPWNTIQPDGSACESMHELPYWIKKLKSIDL